MKNWFDFEADDVEHRIYDCIKMRNPLILEKSIICG